MTADGNDALSDRQRAVLEADTEDFAALLRVAGLDPSRDLRFGNWSNLDLSGADLRGYDFTGTCLTGTRFEKALIAGATFHGAMIERWQLREAADWQDWRSGWTPPERPLSGRHFRDLAVFSDAPFAPEMVVIPRGSFLMGAPSTEGESEDEERPQHPVTVAHRYALARDALTFDEYDVFCEATGHERADDEVWGRGRRPAINVSWEDAEAYCAWLSEQTGAEYRLPSEAEWEYACRAGTTTPFAFGETVSTDRANYNGTFIYGPGSTGAYRERTVPVDELDASNAWGLRHMHGNVAEWCKDCLHESYEGAPTDGRPWFEENGGKCSRRVLRGGSWVNYPWNLRSADRNGVEPDLRIRGIGFRPARTLFTP